VSVINDFLLFKRTVELSLWETLESFFTKHASAVEKGDVERVLWQQQVLQDAVTLANGVVAARQKQNRT